MCLPEPACKQQSPLLHSTILQKFIFARSRLLQLQSCFRAASILVSHSILRSLLPIQTKHKARRKPAKWSWNRFLLIFAFEQEKTIWRVGGRTPDIPVWEEDFACLSDHRARKQYSPVSSVEARKCSSPCAISWRRQSRRGASTYCLVFPLPFDFRQTTFQLPLRFCLITDFHPIAAHTFPSTLDGNLPWNRSALKVATVKVYRL